AFHAAATGQWVRHRHKNGPVADSLGPAGRASFHGGSCVAPHCGLNGSGARGRGGGIPLTRLGQEWRTREIAPCSSGQASDLRPMELYTIDTGFFKLDGGAMFGVVPKVLWGKVHPADEQNLCSWAMRCLLVRTGDHLVLIDNGIGDKQDAKFFGHYHL